MKDDNFWGKSRLSSVKVGIVVRTSLAMFLTVSCIALAWALLNPHNNTYASGQLALATSTTTATPTATTTSTPSPTPTPPPPTGIGPTSLQWYFAEGKVGQGFTQFLTIQNPDPNPAHACQVRLQYLLSSSTPSPKLLTIAPNTRFTELVNADLNQPANAPAYQGVSTIVSVTNPGSCSGVVAERPIYFTNFKGASSGTDVLGATHTGTDFYFADVSSLPGYNSYLTILNPPNGLVASIMVSYYRAGGLLGTDTAMVQPGTRGTIIPHSYGQRVAAWVHASAPVVVERPTYFSNYTTGNAGTVSGSASVVGATAPNANWRFAEGFVGGQFQENLVLANFGASMAAGTLILEYDNGSTLTVPVTVNAHDETSIDVNALTTSQAGVCAPLPCVLSQSVSAQITMTSGQIVAEREMFFHYYRLDRLTGVTVRAQGGTDVTGQAGTAAASAYSFAEGYTNLGYDEWLTVQNPTAAAERVWITLVTGTSHAYQFSIVVGMQSRYTVNINDVVTQNLVHPNGVDDGANERWERVCGGATYVLECQWHPGRQ